MFRTRTSCQANATCFPATAAADDIALHEFRKGEIDIIQKQQQNEINASKKFKKYAWVSEVKKSAK